jgi:uncharacterized protein (UPF0333 family)
MNYHLKNRGQSTLEYAVVIAVIVAALVAMQTYIKRGMMGKLKQGADDMGEQFSSHASTQNYTTNSVVVSTENVASAAVTAKGGLTKSTLSQNSQRYGTDIVSKYKDKDEFWVED